MLWQPHARRWWLWTLQTFACDAAEVLLRAAILPLPFRGSTQGKLIAQSLPSGHNTAAANPAGSPYSTHLAHLLPQNLERLALFGGFVLQTLANLCHTALLKKPALLSCIQ